MQGTMSNLVREDQYERLKETFRNLLLEANNTGSFKRALRMSSAGFLVIWRAVESVLIGGPVYHI